MAKRIIISVILLVIFLAVIIGLFEFKLTINKKIAYAIAHMPVPPVTVSTGIVRSDVVPQAIHIVGSVTAVQGVQISAQISGNVTAIYFRSGKRIKAGQKLVQIDNTTQLAQLKADLAAESLAKTNLQRTENLIKHRAAAQATLDANQAALLQAKAQVAGDRATLEKLAITAPFTGYMGLRQVSLGQYVSPGTPIVALNTWQPLYLDFSIPQNDLAKVRIGQTVKLTVDAYAGKTFTGKVEALSSQVDTASRNIQVQAELSNKRLLLKPGLFGEVELLTGVKNKVVVVNAGAITYNTYGDYVYVVKKTKKAGKTELTVHSALVKTGSPLGSDVVVTSGLKVGETVVTAGQVKLRPGSVVVVSNKIKP
ncbi:MAG: efflux RND transporter periplasmic adaptor subunit [Phycisphaerae bacterium]